MKQIAFLLLNFFFVLRLHSQSAPTEDPVYISFVGSGDIQKSISEGQNFNANTGLGVIFERYSGFENIIQSFELEATLNVATTADTIVAFIENSELQNQRDFGSYILNPISAKQSIFVNSNIYFGYPPSQKSNGISIFNLISTVISGVNFRIIASNNVWNYDGLNTNLGALLLRAGVFHEFIPDNYRLTTGDEPNKSKYSIIIGANYSYRGIMGDITSANSNNIKEHLLGKTNNNFSGVEMNFGFRLNNLRAEFQMPVLKAKGESINGLTNTQFLFSIKFVGGFSLKVN